MYKMRGYIWRWRRNVYARLMINSKSDHYITECYNLGGAIWHPRCGPGPDAKTEVDGPMSIDGQVSSKKCTRMILILILILLHDV